MAQRPYMIEGSLREQVAYPIWDASLLEELSDDKLQVLFEECNLGDLWQTRRDELDRTDVCWGNVLSLGEQQRLQFCRLLWHHEWRMQNRACSRGGFFAVLDEATAALDAVRAP